MWYGRLRGSWGWLVVWARWAGMCEIRQNQPDCRRPDPPLTHFSHSPCSLYLIFMLQPTQPNLVQCCAYSNNSQRGLNSNRQKEQAAEIKYIVCREQPGFSNLRPCVVVVVVWTPWNSLQHYFHSNRVFFAVTMATPTPNFSFFHLSFSKIYFTVRNIICHTGKLSHGQQEKMCFLQ